MTAVLVGLGGPAGSWQRFTHWWWQTTHLTVGTALGAALLAVVLALLWRASR